MLKEKLKNLKPRTKTLIIALIMWSIVVMFAIFLPWAGATIICYLSGLGAWHASDFILVWYQRRKHKYCKHWEIERIIEHEFKFESTIIQINHIRCCICDSIVQPSRIEAVPIYPHSYNKLTTEIKTN